MASISLSAGVPAVVRVHRESTVTLQSGPAPGYRSLSQIFQDDVRAVAASGKRRYKFRIELVDPLTREAVPGYDITVAEYLIDAPASGAAGYDVRPVEKYYVRVDGAGVAPRTMGYFRALSDEEKALALSPARRDYPATYSLDQLKDITRPSKALRGLIKRAGLFKTPVLQSCYQMGYQKPLAEAVSALRPDHVETGNRKLNTPRSIRDGSHHKSYDYKAMGHPARLGERYKYFFAIERDYQGEYEFSCEHEYRLKIPRPAPLCVKVAVSLRAFVIGPSGTTDIAVTPIGQVAQPDLVSPGRNRLIAGQVARLEIAPVFVPGDSEYEVTLTADSNCSLLIEHC